jgi:putative membrane protein
MYDWLRAIHIIVVIAWMGGMLIYPRLLVYRLEGQGDERLEKMMDAAATRTRNIIITPAMILAWLLGIGLASTNFGYYSVQPWFWAKIVLVVIMSGLHGYFIGLGKKIARGERPIETKKLRMLNELPMVIAIFAVIMVVVQPFSR